MLNRTGRIRVLVIEDNPADLMLISEAFREHKVDAELEVLSDGELAYQYWDRFSDGDSPLRPDVVLLDLNLPKRTGLEILRRMRESPECKNLPIIIVSSSGNPRDIAEAEGLGVYRYFRKPTHLDQFLELGRIVKNLHPVPAKA
jgi:two-component system, chemotaxis family, response regulator Rcp1